MLADEFSRWFEGLWQGKSLAITVACITLAIAAALAVVAKNGQPMGKVMGRK